MTVTPLGASCPCGGMVPVKGVTMNAVKMIQKENQLELPLFFLDEEPKTAEVIPFEPKPANEPSPSRHRSPSSNRRAPEASC